jgi:hypothetical protein
MGWGAYVALTLAGAAWLALIGTNIQARLARARLLADDDPLVVEAGRLWTTMPRRLSWLSRPSHRRRRAAAEENVRQDPERAKRYDRLCTELFAWNALETSVALAFTASIIAAIGSFAD